ncbi:MAG: Spy/CpxP family protein refolding chaperone [Bradymonadia bacterium]|jgi:Spy/CpxP family protein refolding chaperone
MSRITVSASILVLAAACLIVGVAHGEPGPDGAERASECEGKRGDHGARHRGKHKGGRFLNPEHFERLADALKIEPKMRASLAAELEAARVERDAQSDAVHAEKKVLRALLDADTPDRAAVLVQVERIGAKKLAMKTLQITTMLDLRAALSPEQRAQLKARMQERRARHGKRGE